MFTTMEKLQMEANSRDSVIRFGDHVIYAYHDFKGEYTALIYEFIDEPGVEFDEIECRITLIDRKESFADGGHAIQWAISRITEESKNV